MNIDKPTERVRHDLRWTLFARIAVCTCGKRADKCKSLKVPNKDRL